MLKKKQDEGVVLLDQVCDHLGLQERQLFSLQIRESSSAITSVAANTHSPRWLEPEKPLKKQIKEYDSSCLILTRCSMNRQAEMGDHCPARLPGYLSKRHFIPEQDEDFLSKVEDLHPQHK
ncbi:Tyrosine-protein phosphatase non-receptor type 3 [Liparis tanakae]|uniref:Tyrosine-protein phosphatase non-receptor type 3 n=1 Tax=Liparis tanakae TaxID=230148 RepID=A0A4Z2ID87_9TELE|nr:Tyrosine-protein phosphatase non-receptor type 3 [Liparis tanakae]